MGIEMEDVMFSRGPNGEAKFEYMAGGESRTLLIEPLNEGVLKTLYDREGGVLKQIAVGGDDDLMVNEIYEVIKDSRSVRKVPYNEVMLNKLCPHCGVGQLRRVREPAGDIKGVPVVPTYVCTSCGGKSYHLTDAHLRSMVNENRSLFTDEELNALNANEEEFLKELKEYIIRIFASKKIIAIK